MKFLYYLIQWTWGIIMNIVGGITFIICKCCRCETYMYRNAVCIVVPWNFGGLELGMFFVRGKKNISVCAHEYGHSIQNLWWGPLFPFVVCIPSAIRYWLREFKTTKTKQSFATVLCCLLTLVSMGIIVLGSAYMACYIIGGLLFLYTAYIYYWLLALEIPKYEKGKVPYDSIWFEGQATALGESANNDKWTWL